MSIAQLSDRTKFSDVDLCVFIIVGVLAENQFTKNGSMDPMTTNDSSDNSPSQSTEPDQSGAPRNKTRGRLIWLGSITLLFGVVLIALPLVTARIATSWLQDNGASNASIENIDINLFTGTVRLMELDASGGAQQRLHIGLAEVDVRWWPLASKRIYVEEIRLQDTQIDFLPDSQGNWQVGGLRFSPAAQSTADTEAAPFEWGIGSELVDLTNVSLTYKDALFDTDMEINKITLGSHFSWLTGAETELVIDMDFNDSPIDLRSTLVPWGELQSISGDLQLNDHLLQDHEDILEQFAGLTDTRGLVSMDLDVSASLNDAGVFDLLVSGPLEITGISFTRDTVTVSNGQLDWQGLIDIKFPVIDNEPLVTVEGDLQLAATQVSLAELELEASLGAFSYNGRFDLFAAQDANQAPTFNLAAMVSGQELALDHNRLDYELARLQSFNLNEIRLNTLEQASVAQLQLNVLQVMADTPNDDNAETNQLLSLNELGLEQVTFSTNTGLLINSVSLWEPVLSIERQAGGGIARVSELQAIFAGAPQQGATQGASQSATQQATQTQNGTAEPMLFIINTLQVMSTNFLDLEDVSVTPPVNFQLSAMDLQINNINSGSTDPMTVQLATGNNTMQLGVTGDVTAFADPMSVNLVASMSALELPRFSPYILGYNINRGRLSVDSEVAITGETLDIQNSVLLEAIQLAGKAADDNEILAQGMAMPLDVALDLLRDSDDHISLDLPVTGSLSDPLFNSADIIRTVMQNALQNAAMSYVTTALQPLGTLLFIGDLASQAAAPRFEPLTMTTGDASLSDENREYLFKIGDLLKERPRLQLTLCGIVTETDREVLATRALRQLQQNVEAELLETQGAQGEEEPGGEPAAIQAPQISDGELLELAAMRTRTATSFLANSVMIESGRLFVCRETLDGAEDARPRVRLSL